MIEFNSNKNVYPVSQRVFSCDIYRTNDPWYRAWVMEEIRNNSDFRSKVEEDSRFMGIDVSNTWMLDTISMDKIGLLQYANDYFRKTNTPFDEFNGLAPTRENRYLGYEYGTLFVWGFFIALINGNARMKDVFSNKDFYKKFGNMISKVFKKYPVTTSSLLYEIDLHFPGNKLMDYANMDDADFDSDTQEGWNNPKADEFNDWLIKWSSNATAKDRMRVSHWFETKKSHKQIFAEINKVAGNPDKFNCRLALFMERLLNNQNLDYFYEKSGFSSKEDLYMAYLGKLDMFDDETKHSFIKKYLLKGKQ